MNNDTIEKPFRIQRPLRICVVTQQLRNIHSGPGLHAQNLIKSLINDGHKVTLIAPSGQIPNGIPFEQSYSVKKPPLVNSQAQWLFLGFSFNKIMKSIERESSFDLIHFTDFREGLFCDTQAPSIANINDTYTTELKGLRYYKQHYNDWFMRWIYYHLSHLLERKFIHRFHIFLANSRFTKEVIINEYPLLQPRTYVVYKSINPDFFKPALLARKNHVNHPPRILFVGSNMQRKGVPNLIKATPQVIKQFPECEIWLAGKDKTIPKLKSLAKQLGIESNLVFWGKQDRNELLYLLGQADIFSMPSLTEAFGVVFLEAMASGLPIVATNVGGIPELIQDRVNGLLVPPDNPQLLANGLIQLLANKKLQKQFSEAGLDTVRRFSVERMMHNTYEIYSTLL